LFPDWDDSKSSVNSIRLKSLVLKYISASDFFLALFRGKKSANKPGSLKKSKKLANQSKFAVTFIARKSPPLQK